jgi:SAM-dependent methyltransferase
MAKAAGFEVEIIDYLDAEGLRRKYGAAGVDVSAVEEVDYISDGRAMTEIIGERHRYSWIVASHVIEHMPNLLAFLLDCEELLKPGGVLVLAVPDKRCCFDILRPISTVGQVLQAHIDKRTRPWPGVIFDDIGYARKRNGRIGWTLEEVAPLLENLPIHHAREFFEQARGSTTYVDVHCWVFVPSSFRLIINALSTFQMIGMGEKHFRLAEGEFFVVLSTDAPPKPSLDFGALALAASEEERAIILGAKDDSSRTCAEVELAFTQQGLPSARADLSAAWEREASNAQLVSAMTLSKSWQLTEPLRRIAAFFRSAKSSELRF